jgi:hypothetical protein
MQKQQAIPLSETNVSFRGAGAEYRTIERRKDGNKGNMQRNDEEAEIKKVKSRKREKDKEDITSG